MKKLLFAFLFLSLSAYSFTLNNGAGAAFKKDVIKVNVAAHTCTNIGVTNSELLSIAEEAVNLFWNRVATSKLEMIGGSIVTVASDFQTGQVCTGSTSNCSPTPALVVSSDILISCNTNAANYSGSNEVLGVTVPNNISGRNIVGALVLINDNGSNTFESRSYDEKVAIVSHEIGHAIGLGHSPVDDSLMYYQSVATRFKLGWDDIDGLTYLYPTEQPFSGCGSISTENQGENLFILFTGFLLMLMIGDIAKRFLGRKKSF